MAGLATTDGFLAQADVWLMEAETELIGSLSEYLELCSNEETNSPFTSHTPGKAPLSPGQAAMRKLRGLVGEACGKRDQRNIYLSQDQCRDMQRRLLKIMSQAPNAAIMECGADCLVLSFDVFHPSEAHGLPPDEAADRADAKKNLFLELVNLLIRTMTLNAKNYETIDRRAVFGCVVFFSRLRAGCSSFGDDVGLCNVLQDFHHSIGKTFMHLMTEFSMKDPVLAIDVAQYFLLYLVALNAEDEPDDEIRERLQVAMTSNYTAPLVKAFSVWSTHASPHAEQIVHLTKPHHGRDLFFKLQTVEHIWWKQFRSFLSAVSIFAENAELSWLEDFSDCFQCLHTVLNKCRPQDQAPLPPGEQVDVGLVKNDKERSVCLVAGIADTLAKVFVDERFTNNDNIPALLTTLYEHLKYPVFNEDTWFTDFEAIHPEFDNHTHAPTVISASLGEIATTLEYKHPMVPIFGPLIMQSLRRKLTPAGGEEREEDEPKDQKKKASGKKGTGKKATSKKSRPAKDSATQPNHEGLSTPTWGEEYAALLVIKELRDTFERLFKKNFDQLIDLFLKFLRREENQFSRHMALHSLESLIAVHCAKIRARFWKEILVACCDIVANTNEAPVSIALALCCIGMLFSAFVDDEEVVCAKDSSIRKKLPAVLKETKLIDKYMLQLIERSPHVNLRIEALRACSELYQFLEEESESFIPQAVPVLVKVISDFPIQMNSLAPQCRAELKDHEESRQTEAYRSLVGRDVYQRHPQLKWITKYLDAFSLYSTCVETSTVLTDAVSSACTREFAVLLGKELNQLMPKMDKLLAEVTEVVDAAKGEHCPTGDQLKTYSRCSESQARIEDQMTRIIVSAWARLLHNLKRDFEPFLEPMMNYILDVAMMDCAPQILIDSDSDAMERTGFETNESRNGHFMEYKFVHEAKGTVTVRLSQTKQQMKIRAVDILAEILNNDFIRSHPRIREYRSRASEVVLDSLRRHDENSDLDNAGDVAYAISQATDDIASHVADLLMALFDSLEGKEQERLAEKKRLGDEFSAEALEAAKLENAEETKEILDRLFVPVLEAMMRLEVDTSIAFSKGAQAVPNFWGALGVAFGSTHKGAISVGNDYSDLFQAVFKKHWLSAADTIVHLRQAIGGMSPQEAAEMQLEEEPIDNVLQSLYEATEAAAMNGFQPCLDALSKNSAEWMNFLGTESVREWGALLAGLSVEARCPDYDKLIPLYLPHFASIAVTPPKASVFMGSPQQTGHYYLGICLDRLHQDVAAGKIPPGSLSGLCKEMWTIVSTYLSKNTPSRFDVAKGKKLKRVMPKDGVVNPRLLEVIETLIATPASGEEGTSSILDDRSKLDSEQLSTGSGDNDDDSFQTDEDELEEEDDERREFMSKGGVEINFISTLLKLLDFCPLEGYPSDNDATLQLCHQALWNFTPTGGWDISEAKIVHKKILERVLLPQVRKRSEEKGAVATGLTAAAEPTTVVGCLLDAPLQDTDLFCLANGLLQASPKYLSQATIKMIAENWELLRPVAEAGGPLRLAHREIVQTTLKSKKPSQNFSRRSGGHGFGM